jgi:ribosomal protein S18 acetylase RimI-like enzyme
VVADVVHVRRPRHDEAAELRDLAERTFRAAFAADNDPADVERYVCRAFAARQIDAELEDPASRFMVATIRDPGNLHQERLVGYAKLRSGPVEPCVSDAAAIELERIYVDQAKLGRGVGAALMAVVLREAAARGHRTIWLGVWEHNHRAIEFYRRWGFEVVGSHVFRLGVDDQTDLVMERPLEPTEAAAPTTG